MKFNFNKQFLSPYVIVIFLLVSACSKPPVQTDKSNQITQSNQSKPSSNIDSNDIVNSDNFAKYSTVYFDFDISTPKQSELYKVTSQAKWLKERSKKQKVSSVIISGYTDIYGSREYNLALGARRANSIKRLLQKQRVSLRIETKSYGKSMLADPDNQALNRRSVTSVQSK